MIILVVLHWAGVIGLIIYSVILTRRLRVAEVEPAQLRERVRILTTERDIARGEAERCHEELEDLAREITETKDKLFNEISVHGFAVQQLKAEREIHASELANGTESALVCDLKKRLSFANAQVKSIAKDRDSAMHDRSLYIAESERRLVEIKQMGQDRQSLLRELASLRKRKPAKPKRRASK